jgi:hypothetical protein
VGLGDDRERAFVELPALLTVSARDVARAYGADTDGPGPDAADTSGDGSATVRLRLDPDTDPERPPFLTVLPPDDFPASAGEFIGAVCAALFGPADDEIRYGRRDDAMEAAIATARGALPEARARFLADRLPPRAHLMVKYGLHRDGRTEYVWATVTSWTDPDTVVGTSTNDAQLDPSGRVGRLVRIAAAEVIDWAYWIDGEGVVEGGWTTEVLTR